MWGAWSISITGVAFCLLTELLQCAHFEQEMEELDSYIALRYIYTQLCLVSLPEERS